MLADDGHADSLDAGEGGGHQALDDVEIVDHQVEDDADVGGAEAEGAEAVTFDEQRLEAHAGDGLEAGVEAFDVADLEASAGGGGRGDEFLCLFHAEGHGLFNQHGEAATKEGEGDGVVVEGGHDDTDGLRAIEEEGRVCGGRNLELASDGAGLFLGGVHNADKFDIGHLRVHPGVLLAQMPDADDADLEAAHARPPRSWRVHSR